MKKWNIGGEYAVVTASTDGAFQVIWSDARSGKFQLWTSRMVVFLREQSWQDGASKASFSDAVKRTRPRP